MNALGILLVLGSAICHASWNLLAKARSDPIEFLRLAMGYSTVLYLPLFLFAQAHVLYSRTYLICAAVSGVALGLFMYSLGMAYRHGRVSIAYPIARSFPILVLAWAGLFLGEVPSPQAVCGILLIIGGCFVLPMKRWEYGEDGFSWSHYRNWSCLWAFGAALFTSLFSIVDKVAAESIPAEPVLESMATRIIYVYLQNAVCWLVLAIVPVASAGLALPEPSKRQALTAGAIFLVSYSLIVIALASNPVAYVVSFRQISVVIAAVVSMNFLEREHSWPRLIGVALIFLGVLAVGLA